jgi:Tfp pilus tip-associated adhesin PilY1
MKIWQISGRYIIKKDTPMNTIKKHLPIFLPALLLLALCMNGTAAFAVTAESFNSIPPFVRTGADPNVMLDLSVETPMQGAAYNDRCADVNNDGTVNIATECSGRDSTDGDVGRYYLPNHKYLGIFDPEKEYDYTGGRFEPRGPTNLPNHSIKTSTRYSGNFLNWATMTAIDEFRYALTGGRRTVDSTTQTVIRRANMLLSSNNSWFPLKKISTGNPVSVAPNTVGPFGANATIYVYNHGFQVDIGTTRNVNNVTNLLKTNLNVQVLVCSQTYGLEENCVSHSNGTIFKPEGIIQKHADHMRFAAMSYVLDNSRTRGGGVLRSTMKYVGPTLPDGTVNPRREYGTDGIIPSDASGLNPDSISGVTNSGVINYLNKFGEAGGYKSLDPAGELFYECLRYFKHIGPTPEYASGLTAAQLEDFPAITNWDDPMQSWCQPNFIIGINDANPWLDKKLPGTFFGTRWFMGIDNNDDYGEPTNPDSINVKDLTNTVGDLEGLTGTQQKIGCTALTCDNDCTNPKTLTHLGEVMGTCPYPPKQNSYYIAGMAYYAHTQDIRSDLPGRQTISTFMIDTQEYSSTPLLGQMNMLWLTGKYGSFNEKDNPDPENLNPTNTGNTRRPNDIEEWDSDHDGNPDGYILADDPDKIGEQLGKIFATIASHGSSATAASVISGSQSGEGAIYQSIFFTQLPDSSSPPEIVTWAGSAHALFVDELGRMREDTPQGAPTPAQNHILDPNDLVIEFKQVKLPNNQIEVTVNKTDVSDPNNPTTVTGLPITSIAYLWSSEGWLNGISNADIVTQRTYNTAMDQRYIFTFIDINGNHIADPGETLPFVSPTPPTATQLDGIAHPDTIYPYIPVSFDSTALPFFVNATNRGEFLQKQTQRVINFTRGLDQGQITLGAGGIVPAFRSRQFNLNGTMGTWRLGDIVNSSPTSVSKPAEALHLLYRDTSYATFANRYQQRRTVIYAGANDGMLHAFNGGFFEDRFDVFPATLDGRPDVEYLLQPKDRTGTTITTDASSNPIAPHKLGAELWAYVPYNLLPHLYWPTEADYGLKKHVYFNDLKPRIFDAKIFFDKITGMPIDADHPGGWGTVLVGGMRFGGGKIDVDMNRNDGTVNSPDRTMSSAYYILDITNPELPPTVLAEINFPGLGYTTCYPTAVPMAEIGGSTVPNVPGTTVSSSRNNWYLVFGSGPAETDGTPGTGTSLTAAISNQKANLYVVDLVELVQNKSLVTLTRNGGFSPPAVPCPHCYERFDTVVNTSPAVNEPNAFISDPISVDYQLDYKSDAVYFGTVSGNTTDGWGGEMRRIVIDNHQDPADWISDSILLGSETAAGIHQPITAAPTASTDRNGRRWVFFGTGRFFVTGDAQNSDQQTYYGIKEPVDTSNNPTWATVTRQFASGPPSQPGLLDVSNAQVFTDRSVIGIPNPPSPATPINTWNRLVEEIDLHSGWMLNFSRSGERNIGQAALLGSTLTFTTYIPPTDVCEFDGESILYAVFYTTGTAYFNPMIGTIWNSTEGKFESRREMSLGYGLASTPNVHVGGKTGSTVFVQDSTGQIHTIDELNATPSKSGMRAWKLNEN